jgi:hypothetical protein
MPLRHFGKRGLLGQVRIGDAIETAIDTLDRSAVGQPPNVGPRNLVLIEIASPNRARFRELEHHADLARGLLRHVILMILNVGHSMHRPTESTMVRVKSASDADNFRVAVVPEVGAGERAGSGAQPSVPRSSTLASESFGQPPTSSTLGRGEICRLKTSVKSDPLLLLSARRNAY